MAALLAGARPCVSRGLSLPVCCAPRPRASRGWPRRARAAATLLFTLLARAALRRPCGVVPALARVRRRTLRACARAAAARQAPAPRARRPGGGPDRAGAGAADRRRAPDAQLPRAAPRRPRLRHARRLHVPVRARTARSSRTDRRFGALPPRLPRSAARAPGRDFGGDRRERARSTKARAAIASAARTCRTRPDAGPAAQLDVRGRRLLPDDGDRRARRPAVRDRRPPVGARERRDQPLGGAAAVARAARRRPAPAAAGDRQRGTPSSASWRT